MIDAHQSEPAIGPLQDVLDYLSDAIRLNGRVVERLSDYQLAGGRSFVFHQHELENLPGVVHNTFDPDGPVWLAVEPLAATEPPAIDSELGIWIELSADPDLRPLIRESALTTVDVSEKDRLIAAGQARAEDFAPAITHDASARLWSVNLRLEQLPDLVALIDRYITGPWTAWAAAERPYRRTIAICRRLREMTRAIGLDGTDRTCEIVWGIGVLHGRHHDSDLDLPLLERLVEIEILDSPDAEVRIRPRMVGATVNFKALEALVPDAAHSARGSVERLLEAIEHDGELSPFLPASFEPILSTIRSHLDIYRSVAPEAAASLPEIGGDLVVSDRWVIFARPRSDDSVLRDIERLKHAIELAPSSACCLSGVANFLLPAPDHDAKAALRRQLSGVIGDPIDIAPATRVVTTDQGDLFFPLPAGDDQIEMVRQLERSDGLVIQGVLGIDRTAPIANVVCHHLALGLRVLVVSRNETALALLYEKLPRAIRDLTANLIGSDKQMLRHAEAVVNRLQSIVDAINVSDQVDQINRLEREIIATRHEISDLDKEMVDIASRNRQQLSDLSELPFDIVKMFIAGRDAYSWFTDRPTQFLAGTDALVSAVDAARDARLRVSGDLKYIDDDLPEIATLPDAATLMRLHEDLRRTAEPPTGESRDNQLARHAVAVLGLEGAGNLAVDLDALVSAHRAIADEPWLATLSPLGIHAGQVSADVDLVVDFAHDASLQLARRTGFLMLPVDAPADTFANQELIDIVDRLSAGERAFSAFSRAGRALKPAIDAITVAGFAPSARADWAHVRDYLAWRRDLHSLRARWRSLAAEIGAPAPEPDSSHMFRDIERLAKCIDGAIVTAELAKRNLTTVGPKLSMPDGEIAAMLGDVRRLAAFSTAVRSTASRIADQRFECTRLDGLFAGNGAVASLVRADVLSQIGREDVDPREIEKRWNSIRALIQSLGEHRQDFELINKVGLALIDAGAPAFARRILTERAHRETGDSVLVADWVSAWNWAGLMGQTEGLGRHRRLRDLSDQRLELQTRLREVFEAVVGARIHLGFAQNTSSTVRQALTVFMITLQKMKATCSGPTACRLRLMARQALENCYEGIPCQIMPAWRVADQLPARLGAFDLVVIDDASQSDLREFTAMLRGRKVLVVDEDRQTAGKMIGLSGRNVERIEHNLLRGVPPAIRQFLLPGASLSDLVKVLFPDRMIRLRDQFHRIDSTTSPSPVLPAQRAKPRAPVFEDLAPSGAMARGPDERVLPQESKMRRTPDLEDEIASVAELLSLTRRNREDRPTEARVAIGSPPDWLSGWAGSSVRRTEIDATCRRAPDSMTAEGRAGAALPTAATLVSETAQRGTDAVLPPELGGINPSPSSPRQLLASEELPKRGRRSRHRRMMVTAAVAAMMMFAASVYWQATPNRFPMLWSGAVPASALPRETALPKIAAERIAPDGKQLATGNDGATGGGPPVARAALYRENPSNPSGKRYLGTVTWHLDQGVGSGPASSALIKCEVEIDKQMSATLSLRRNIDTELPASHLMEVKFNWSDDAIHSGVDALKALRMKTDETAIGPELSAQIAKVTPKFFMVALSAVDVDMKRNIQLLKGKQWFDILIVFNNGDRAILTIEKGADGERAFKDAFAAWGQ
jgi:hypothetical protein